MSRLVIALTALLSLIGGAVIAGYLFVFSAQPDRAAAAVPERTTFYATVYLQPSTGQKLNLGALMERVPGFADPAALDQKIHEITARLLREAGIDYQADVKPWLGNQLSLAVQPEGVDPERANVLAVIEVRDTEAARAAIERIATNLGLAARSEAYEGVDLFVADDTSWALLDDVLLLGSSADAVRAALDADAGRASSLADSDRFERAMDQVPADHLAAVYLDLAGFGSAAGFSDQLDGYDTASLALLVEPDGLRLEGSAPFDEDSASEHASEAFALSTEPSGLTEWMPADTQAEAVIYGLSQSVRAAEEQLGGGAGGDEVVDALSQLRAVAALGLGISVDEDLLPLFDRETAVALTGLEGEVPAGQLILRPADPAAAQAALERMRDALEERGASVEEDEVEGQPVTSVEVPELGTVAYAVSDGVVVLGLSPADVAAAIQARASGETLAASERYRSAWELAGAHGGNEVWLDVAALVDAAGDGLGVTGEARDILLQAGALAMTAPARPDEARSEFHVVLTAR